MNCNCNINKKECGCKFNTGRFKTCDTSRIIINGRNRSQLNWNEISVPEIVTIPAEKPNIEEIDEVLVDAKIDCVKLIETPFAYQIYERIATPVEVTAAINVINGAVVDITPILNAVEAIIAIPGLPVIPQVAALQAALTAVTEAETALTTAINDALTALEAPCIAAQTIKLLLEAVQAAINLLQLALNALIAAANALVAAVATIPLVGPAVAAAVTVLLNAITVITNQLLAVITAILATITLIGNTLFFAILPNEEGTCLSGRKLIVEGTIKQKIVYTGMVTSQSVHSTHNCIPFTAFIIAYAKFLGSEPEENVEVLIDPETCTTEIITGFPYDPEQGINVDLCEEFCVDSFVEDVFAYALDERTIFKNITLFLKASPVIQCQ